MTEEERWNVLVEVEDQREGCVVLSEWCAFIVCEADEAFLKGAYLACILTAVAGAETYLRAEFDGTPNVTLAALIDRVPIDPELAVNLHRLRRYRNKWVHVSEPWEDEELLDDPDRFKSELEQMAVFAIRTLRQTIFVKQWLGPGPPPLNPKMKIRTNHKP